MRDLISRQKRAEIVKLEQSMRLGAQPLSMSLVWGQALRQLHTEENENMAEGTIKRLTDKGFGFIDVGNGNDLFFHMSSLDGVHYDDLQEGQRVSFTEGQGPKGPRAENVSVV